MPESIIRSDSSHEEKADEPLEEDEEQEESEAATAKPVATGQNIIWTPRFLLLFAGTLILGTSLDSLTASGWSVGLLTSLGAWFILGYDGLAMLGWLILGVVTRSRWIRVGSIFGSFCSLFLGLDIFIHVFGVSPNAPVLSYVNVATCTALLGAYIGLSIEGTLLSAWDFWLFLLLPALSGGGVELTYLLTPQASIITTENALATATLIAASLVWWARPSCWKRLPGPTLIFGIVPVILLSMALVNGTMHNYFLLQVLIPRISTSANLNNFFFAQFILLCLLLGCMRLTKSEIRN